MIAALDPAALALVIGVLSGLAILLVGIALAGSASRNYARRLRAIAARQPAAGPAGIARLRPLARRSSTPGIDRLFRLLPRRAALAARLSRTGYGISIGQYGLGSIAAAMVFALLFLFVAGFAFGPSLLLGAALAIALPHWLIGRLGRRRTARFIQLFPEAIDLMVRALRAGLPISEAIVNAGREVGNPVGAELRGIEAGMKLGRDLDSLLWDIATRIAIPEFRFFIIALSVQRETGGNLAETLNNLSEVLRRRRAMRAKARAMASEARASTAILGSLPIVVIGVLSFTSPTYIAPLFNDIRGLLLLGLGVTMLITGITIMVRMARFEI
ncbi:MAG TPA: type II secretion system F family protein [Stellaceae bacterium]|nr:type II secretion system F family protein [Stellaceae bacterium]